jgi:hypothetical protein
MKNSISRVRASSLAACAASVVAASAGAAVSYSTSFEAPFTTGDIAGQQGWATSVEGGSSGFIVGNVAGRARTGTQYVSTDTSLNSSGWQWWEGSASTGGQAQTAAQLAEPGSSIVRVSSWVNVFAAAASTTRTSYAGIQGYDGAVASMGFIRVTSAGGLQLNNGTTTLAATITGFALNQWNKIGIEFDYGADKIRFYFNDVLIDLSSQSGFDAFTKTSFGDIDLFRSRTSGTGGHTLLWDDYSVETIPAPGAIALLGVAGLVGARRRR